MREGDERERQTTSAEPTSVAGDEVEHADATAQASLLPNLLILGAAKSGTSSLYSYLAQHPDVFMSRFKEPTFFVWGGREYDVSGGRPERGVITDMDSYLALFADARGEQIRGEASTGYLHTPGVADRIRAQMPDVRLMAILRNPIDRAYSAFLHARRSGFEPISDFEQALHEEPERVRNRWIGLTQYTTVGMYAHQVGHYLAAFPREQIRIYLFDDLVREPMTLAKDAYRYLGVSDAFEPDISKRRNRGYVVHSILLYRSLKRLRNTSFGQRLPGRFARPIGRLNERSKEQLSHSARRRLAAVFGADVVRLSHMLDRDLSPWLEGGTVPAMQHGTEMGTCPRPWRSEDEDPGIMSRHS